MEVGNLTSPSQTVGWRTFKVPEFCLISKGPTPAAHSHPYLPAQPSEVTPENLPPVSFFRYRLGLKLRLLQNPENIFCAIFMILWSFCLDSMMGKMSPSLPPVGRGQCPPHWQLYVGWVPWKQTERDLHWERLLESTSYWSESLLEWLL